VRSALPGYYTPSESEFVELWSRGLFAFDASSLLLVHRLPITTRKQLLATLVKMRERIWLPHQAAVEYQENRPRVIAEQRSRFTDVRELLNKVRKTLDDGLSVLELRKRHASIDPDELFGPVSAAMETAIRTLTDRESEQPGPAAEDPIRREFDSLFEGRVGPPFPSQARLDEIYAQGAKRYAELRPPGYVDESKARTKGRDAHLYGGLSLRHEFGDLLLWLQVIEFSKSSRATHVALVTDDEKEDWWWRVSGQTLGPRPELADEIRRQADVSVFYVYNTERFLEFARRHLDVEVSPESIAAVREAAQFGAAGAGASFDSALEVVLKWLLEQYPGSRIESGQAAADFFRFGSDDTLEAVYEVVAAPLQRIHLMHVAQGVRNEAYSRSAKEAVVVAVCRSIDDVGPIMASASDLKKSGVLLVVGVVDGTPPKLVPFPF
jgi:hypothetical protein